MAPERGQLTQGTLLQEAEMITTVVLQEQAREATRNEDSFINIRERLGYAEPEAVDLSGIVDTRVAGIDKAVRAEYLSRAIPLTQNSVDTTYKSRVAIEQILKDEDDRVVIIVGPCSLHDPESALEYAQKVAEWRELYGKNLEIVMRAYVEKPRTTLGWKGLVNDPNLDGSTNISLGLTLSRLLLTQITHMGVPVAIERIDPRIAKHFNGLSTYDAIGARDVESTRGRNSMSITSSIAGFKNATNGDMQAAVNGVKTANAGHSFLGDDENDDIAELKSTGNDTAHVILRGGGGKTNYDEVSIRHAKTLLARDSLLEKVGVDVSHDNTINPGTGKKEYSRQVDVGNELARQINLGEMAIAVIMIESNLKEGKQPFTPGETDPTTLDPELSITDAGIGIKQTEQLLQTISDAVTTRRQLLAA